MAIRQFNCKVTLERGIVGINKIPSASHKEALKKYLKQLGITNNLDIVNIKAEQVNEYYSKGYTLAEVTDCYTGNTIKYAISGIPFGM